MELGASRAFSYIYVLITTNMKLIKMEPAVSRAVSFISLYQKRVINLWKTNQSDLGQVPSNLFIKTYTKSLEMEPEASKAAFLHTYSLKPKANQ